MTERLGILGGGQLGRMLALAARPLGLSVTVLEPNPEAPARDAATHLRADYDDAEALHQLAECGRITFEFENIPDSVAAQLAKSCELYPPPASLSISQDRWVEKNTLRELGIDTARFEKVDCLEDAQAAFDKLGPMLLKTRRFGYDGKGQAAVRKQADLEAAYASLQGAPAIAEEFVSFKRELSVIVCRAQDGQSVVYPVVQNIHEAGILRTSLAPAPELDPAIEKLAHEAAQKLTNHMNYVGVLALELFELEGRVVANEFAPRVHNSGHWTIEGAVTSQFENHVRAVCGMPLGDASLRQPSVMINLIGNIPDKASVLSIQDAHLHDYNKAARPGRKVGHVTILGATLKEAQAKSQLFQVSP